MLVKLSQHGQPRSAVRVFNSSHAYESVSVRHLFFTAIAAIRLPLQHVNDRLPVHTTRVQADERHHDFPREAVEY